MAYVTPADVRRVCNFPATAAPISDEDLKEFIIDSQSEVQDIYKTKFGKVDVSGTADSGTTTTVTDTGAFVDPDGSFDYTGYVIWITGGTGSGQYREITTNTDDVVTVSPAFDTAPDNTSTYRVLLLGYADETVDGNGTDTQHTRKQPLINLNALTINSVDITTSYVYKYLPQAKLVLSMSAEAKFFDSSYPQLVDMKYIYGVYPIPRIIQRLCAIIAGMRALTAQIAGTYDDFSSISLPGGVTASKGEPYVNIQSALSKLQTEAKGIVYGDPSQALGSDFRSAPSYRPFSEFR